MSLSIGLSSGGIGCHGGCDHWMGTVDTGYWLYEYVQSWRRPLCGKTAISNFVGFSPTDAEKEERRDLSQHAYEMVDVDLTILVQNSVSLRARTGPRTNSLSTRNLAQKEVKPVCP